MFFKWNMSISIPKYDIRMILGEVFKVQMSVGIAMVVTDA